MKKHTYMYILLGVVAVVFIAMLLLLSPWLNIVDIEITGTNRLSNETLIREFGLNEPTNILAINKYILKQRVETNHYIEDITVTKTYPTSITIEIHEREVIGYVPYIKNYLYIDTSGRVIDIQPGYTEILPVIEGLDFDSFYLGEILDVKNEETFYVVMQLTNAIHEKEVLGNVSYIDLSNTDNILLQIKNVQVVFGKSEQIQTKVNTMEEIFKNFSDEEKGTLYIEDAEQDPIFRFTT